MIRSVLLAACRWARQKLDGIERLAQNGNGIQGKMEVGDGSRSAHGSTLDPNTQGCRQSDATDADAGCGGGDSVAVNYGSLSRSQQSNLTLQIPDRVSHLSLSLESRQSDTVLTVPEGRQMEMRQSLQTLTLPLKVPS